MFAFHFQKKSRLESIFPTHKKHFAGYLRPSWSIQTPWNFGLWFRVIWGVLLHDLWVATTMKMPPMPINAHQCPSLWYSLLTCSSSQFIWKGNFPTGHSRPWTFTLDTLEFYTDHHMNAVKCRWWHQRGSRQARGYVPGLSPLNPDRRNPPPISLSPPPTPSTPLLPSCVVKTSHDRRPHAFKRTPQWWGLHVKSGEHCEAVLPEQRAHDRHPHLLPLGLSHPCRPPRSRLLDLRRLVQARFHRN